MSNLFVLKLLTVTLHTAILFLVESQTHLLCNCRRQGKRRCWCLAFPFLTDTQPSAFCIVVPPPLHDFLRVLARAIGLRRNQQQQQQHARVCVAGMWRTYKDGEWIPGLTFLPVFGSLTAASVPEGCDAFWEMWHTTWPEISGYILCLTGYVLL